MSVIPWPLLAWRTWNMPPRKVAGWLTPPPRAVTSSTVPWRASMTELTGRTSLEVSGTQREVPDSRTSTVPLAVPATTVRPRAGSGVGAEAVGAVWGVGAGWPSGGAGVPSGEGGGEAGAVPLVVKLPSGP